MYARAFADEGAWSAPSGSSVPEGRQPAAVPALQPPAAPSSAGGGYVSDTRGRWPVLAAIVAFHALLIAAAILIRVEVDRRDREERLTTFSVAEPSPPPPAPAEPTTETPSPSAVFAPPRQIALPVPSPVQAISVPVPPEQPVAVAAAEPAPPAPQPAAAAPITPPDFRAGQLDNPAPAYPYLSRKAREEGVVLLRVLVSREGRAKQLQVDKSSGSSRLDDAALQTVRKWRFLPARRAGEPVEAWVIVPVTFSLS